MLTLLLPTNKLIAFNHILKNDSLQHLIDVREHCDVEFNIVGQGSFDLNASERAKEILLKFDIGLNFKEMEQESPCRISHLRQIAANMSKKSKYYMFVDDNMEFRNGTKLYPKTSGQRYVQALRHLDGNDDCGLVSCVSFFGGHAYKEEIRESLPHSVASTSRGLIFKNAFDGKLFHDDVLKLHGGYEESAAGLWFNLHGYHMAKQFNNPTHHHDLKKIGRKEYGDEDHGLHDGNLSESQILNWVRIHRPGYVWMKSKFWY
jgi:hypothetical protein